MARTDFITSLGIQRASSPEGPFAEKIDNPTGLKWSTPNSALLMVNELGYRKEAAPGQLRPGCAPPNVHHQPNTPISLLVGRSNGNYGAYFLADQQFVQLAPVAGQVARGVYAGVSAMYAPPKFNRFSQYYELRAYGIGLLPSRPGDMVSSVIGATSLATILSMPPCRAASSRMVAACRSPQRTAQRSRLEEVPVSRAEYIAAMGSDL